MPTISVSNLTASPLVLPGGHYSGLVDAGATVSITVDDTDEFLGLASIVALIAAGTISVEASTSDPNVRPVPVYATTSLPVATTYPSGTLVWDSTRMKPLATVSDIWRDQTVVIAGMAAALGALTNVPTNALAFCTDIGAGTLVRYDGANFVQVNLSLPIDTGAGVPAGVLGQLFFDTVTQSLLVCTGAPGTWDTVFVAPTGPTATPPAAAATVTGGAYFDTDTSRLAFRVGANWLHLPVVNYDSFVNIAAIRTADAVVAAGQYGWDSTLNRLAVYNNLAAPGPWCTETTVGMYADAAGHRYLGTLIFDPTGFQNTMAGNGVLRVNLTAGANDWHQSAIVVPIYANTAAFPTSGAFPAAAHMPQGSLGLDASAVGAPGAKLYVVRAGNWTAGI